MGDTGSGVRRDQRKRNPFIFGLARALLHHPIEQYLASGYLPRGDLL
jgi:hypothetical protein